MSTVKKFSDNPIKFLNYYVCRKTGKIFEKSYSDSVTTNYILKFNKDTGRMAIYVANRYVESINNKHHKTNPLLVEVNMNQVDLTKWYKIFMKCVINCIKNNVQIYIDLTK